jgi:indole-3-glycerol phosphate synthase
MNILDEIIAKKKQEIVSRKNTTSLSDLESRPLFSREVLSLKDFLLDDTKTGIIGEFKRRSPSKGIINSKADVYAVTSGYVSHGASALSILTDSDFFGGSSEDLIRSRGNKVPILRKDFIIDEYQIVESKAIGADAVLLIASCLNPGEVRKLSQFAKKLGLEVLLEVHNEKELQHICEETDLVGVNNRDLKTFTVDINLSVALSNKIDPEKIKIAESGISNPDTVCHLKKFGFRGFLIGEVFMKEADPAIAFASFVNQLKNAV